MNTTNETPKWFAEVETTVLFYDLDPLNVVWHGNYAKFYEIARTKLLKSFNYCYDEMKESGYLWPIVDMHSRYVRPATLGQRLKIRADLVEWEYRLKIDYLITDAESGEKIHRGTTVQVAIDSKTKEMCFVSPPILFEKLGLDPL